MGKIDKGILFYKLGYQFTTPGLYCVKEDTKDFDEYRFYKGGIIDDWPDDIYFIFDGAPEENFLNGGLHWRLVSDQVRQVFEDNDVQGVQFLPVTVIHNKTGKQLGPYWVINVVQSVKKLEWNLIKDFLFVRRSTGLYISDSLKRKLEQAKVTSGASFRPISAKILGIK